jgi:hypothetical protein
LSNINDFKYLSRFFGHVAESRRRKSMGRRAGTPVAELGRWAVTPLAELVRRAGASVAERVRRAGASVAELVRWAGASVAELVRWAVTPLAEWRRVQGLVLRGPKSGYISSVCLIFTLDGYFVKITKRISGFPKAL